jgi:hypothetical protein
MATFWRGYLVKDANNHYSITNDAQHEGDPSPQTNGIMSLGLVQFLLQGPSSQHRPRRRPSDATRLADRLTNLGPIPVRETERWSSNHLVSAIGTTAA